ncbi:MAG: TetR/AcrR family transcriptional regulator [Actinobacteria bacterium]|nr:TetR/AcrR family transcriptional regulator [Actinomycetota bacterium]
MVRNESGTDRRSGSETRAEIRRVALALFTERGFEGTSIRDIVEAVGMQKSSLYYHFENKDAIILSLLDERRAESEKLIAWARRQEPRPGLLAEVAMRWLDSIGDDQIAGIRFADANRPAMRRLSGGLAEQQPHGLDALVDIVLPEDATDDQKLRARMVFHQVQAAIDSSGGMNATTETLVHAARTAATVIADAIAHEVQP